MKPVEKKHPTWSRQGWKNYIGHNVPDDKIRKWTEGPYIIQTWPNERFWYILKLLSIENAKWKLTFRNVSISNPPLSSRKSFPHFYFTPNYPEGPPSLILQHLTPLSHCRQHLPEIYRSSDTFVIHLIFQTTVKVSPDVQFAVFVENRIEPWLKLGEKPLLTAFLSGNASSFLPDHSRSAILSNKLPSNSLHTMK